MKSLNAKLALSIFAFVAMLASPAFAKNAQQARLSNASSVYGSLAYSAIPGYDGNGDVVAIPDPDRSGPSRRS